MGLIKGKKEAPCKSVCRDALKGIENLHHLIVETTFLNHNAAGCEQSGHTNAQLLAQGLARLTRPLRLQRGQVIAF